MCGGGGPSHLIWCLQSMTTNEVEAALTDVFRGVFGRPDLLLGRDMTADDISGWDSARMVEIIIETEARFGVSFTTRETDRLTQVGDLVDLVERKTNAG